MENENLKLLREYYALHKNNKDVDKLEEDVNSDLILANIVKRIIKQDDNYTNASFGAYECKLYIDGCVEYKSQEEKEFIVNYIKNLRGDIDDK